MCTYIDGTGRGVTGYEVGAAGFHQGTRYAPSRSLSLSLCLNHSLSLTLSLSLSNNGSRALSDSRVMIGRLVH